MNAEHDARIKDLYENGECPDCGEVIPDEAIEGEECHNCGHVWTQLHECDDRKPYRKQPREKTMKINAVNVVEYFNGTIQNIHSFSDDKEGNKEAEELFGKIAKENDFSEGDVEVGLEDGYVECCSSDYQLFLTHS